MKIYLKNAVKHFFPNPSFVQIYFEAIANAIDASATKVEILIEIDSYKKPDSLKLIISDNGVGFTDSRFEKFSNLMSVDEKTHKGVGRLVFLQYFKKINFISQFDSKQRKFTLYNKFDGECKLIKSKSSDTGTEIRFMNFDGDKVKSYDYLRPNGIKEEILKRFYPLFYRFKSEKRDLKIGIELKTKEENDDYNFRSGKAEIDVKLLPDLNSISIPATGIDMFEKLHLKYSIEKSEEVTSVITAISVDERTIEMDVLSEEKVPQGYKLIFLLYSDYFKGRSDPSRQNLKIPQSELKTTKDIFRKNVADILTNEISEIIERNKKIHNELTETYPHLSGYFNENEIGLINRNEILESAQGSFFKEQKEILEATSLTNEQFEKSLNISSRLLTEYVLYRNIIINKLYKIDLNSSEKDIHNIITPQGEVFNSGKLTEDLYKNNAWILDDKYMSYSTIMSEKRMDKIVEEVTKDEISDDGKRPDIALIFSDDPEVKDDKKVDLVIVELKKMNLSLERKNDVVVQLRSRAKKLLDLFPDKIQRIWFYGILDIDEEFKLFLKSSGYLELYSKDTVMYKNQDIFVTDEKIIPAGIFIQSFDALIKDAKARNHTFLEILKKGLNKTVN